MDKFNTVIIVNIKIESHYIEQVKELCYLGSQITTDNMGIEHVKKRIELAKLVFKKKRNLLVNQNL